jgi:hypothetical protein
MRIIGVAICFGLCWGCLASSALAQRESGENKVVGAVWQYTVKESPRKDAKEIVAGRFRATRDGKVYNTKGGQVGTYSYTTKARDRVTLNITQGKLKGSIELTKSTIDPPIWQGPWKPENGSSGHMTLRMLKD